MDYNGDQPQSIINREMLNFKSIIKFAVLDQSEQNNRSTSVQGLVLVGHITELCYRLQKSINRMFLREATKNGKGYTADMYEMYICGCYLRRVIHKKKRKKYWWPLEVSRALIRF